MTTATKFKTMKDLPRVDYLSPGNPLCAGCGGVLAVRLFHKVLGPHAIWVNAAGCMTVITTYPLSPLKSNWFYTAFASAPAGAQGVRDALDVLIAKGKVKPSEDMKVVVVTGDGAAYDIGLQSTSGAIQRNLDFYYLVYDNESYGNTGFQMSASTPFGSSTKTTPPTSRFPIGNESPKKDLFEIWRAHKPPYVATLSSAHVVDFLRKVEAGTTMKGPKLYLAMAGCPTGWGFGAEETIRVERLAVETGVWPLKEAVDGITKHTYVPRALKPVSEYLKTQERFAHLFELEQRNAPVAAIQESVNSYWRAVSAAEGVQVRLVE